MSSIVRNAARWVGRHAFPAAAASVIAVGAAGGGIGYAVASHHTSPTTSSGPASSQSPASSPLAGHPPGGRAASMIKHALTLLASQTGQTVAAVRSQLAAGKSIDDIAGAKAPAIESAILGVITKLADKAVANGRLPAAQEAGDLALAKTRIEALMAAPGTQLIKDAQQALQFLKTHGHKSGTAPPPATPSPTA